MIIVDEAPDGRGVTTAHSLPTYLDIVHSCVVFVVRDKTSFSVNSIKQIGFIYFFVFIISNNIIIVV